MDATNARRSERACVARPTTNAVVQRSGTSRGSTSFASQIFSVPHGTVVGALPIADGREACRRAAVAASLRTPHLTATRGRWSNRNRGV